MSGSSKKTLIKVIKYTVMLLVLFVLQSMVFSRLRIMGIAPLILPVAVVAVALLEDATWSGAFGIAAGVFCDVSYSESMVFFTVLLPIMGIALGLLSEYFLTRGLLSYLLCCVLSLAAIAFFQMFAFLVFQDVNPQALLKTALLQSLYSLILAVPVYYFAKFAGRKGPVQ